MPEFMKLSARVRECAENNTAVASAGSNKQPRRRYITNLSRVGAGNRQCCCGRRPRGFVIVGFC